jgi:2-(1,2-epoxy-1,2-dihydrophenyl)acetyl-CoA isomerase
VTLKCVDYAHEDEISFITLCRGERGNPINKQMTGELRDAVAAAHCDGAKVIVLSSTGRIFCVGGDLSAFSDEPDLPAYVDDLADELHRTIIELIRSPAIVVSIVQGPAAGVGFPLAAAADIVVAGASATFILGYTKVGLSVDGGSSLLSHTLGLHRALRLALLNDTMSAAEAAAAGLVARVFEDSALQGEADKLIRRLARGPRAAQAAAKRLLRDTARNAPERALHAETSAIRAMAATSDAHEGIRAFRDKHPPVFGN